MSLRITTWNVNGIRNPFSHPPWSGTRTYEVMFDILETDIVCMQETKIQKKDLKDEMVLLKGWDCFFTFPKHKKGYSGVAIYTRQSKCNPIKAEEGITGVLEPRPGQSYLSLPASESIGGYPSLSRKDALLLDSEGRCLVLDFGGFVLIGVYCPAAAGEERDDFRTAFDAAVSERVRNLVEVLHRRVVVVGDLNIARDVLDSAPAKERMKNSGLEDFKDTPTRQILDKLLKPHPTGIMADLCREYFPNRLGMYTCWETRIDARPANYGARIDYILCSLDMEAWFSEANIQEGLMGSDHCPVYGVMKEKIVVEGEERYVLDMVNPAGLFIKGNRQHSQLLPKLKLSAKLLPEFGGRRTIKEMFTTSFTNPKLAPKSAPSPARAEPPADASDSPDVPSTPEHQETPPTSQAPGIPPPAVKQVGTSGPPPSKRRKTSATATAGRGPTKKTIPPGQQSLVGFFKNNAPVKAEVKTAPAGPPSAGPGMGRAYPIGQPSPTPAGEPITEEWGFVDPEASKESWSRILAKPPAPLCDQHREPCTQRVTKKPGPNCGRSFWMCSRPTGANGNMVVRGEQGEQGEWKCNYFKWSSDWAGEGRAPS